MREWLSSDGFCGKNGAPPYKIEVAEQAKNVSTRATLAVEPYRGCKV